MSPWPQWVPHIGLLGVVRTDTDGDNSIGTMRRERGRGARLGHHQGAAYPLPQTQASGLCELLYLVHVHFTCDDIIELQ